jgi:hypothetical protein
VRREYQVLYGPAWEEKFRSASDTPLDKARAEHAAWAAKVKGRIASLRANKDHKGVDLTQRQADELAGDWYRWFASQHLDNPGDAKRWSALREVLWDMAETAGDPELREADFNDPEVLGVTETEAKASQFLTDRGIALTAAGRTRFLSALVREFLAARKTLERRARGDWGPDQHLDQLAPSPNLAPVMASPSSNGQHRSAVTGGQAQLPSAVEIFEASCEGRALKPSTIMNHRTVFVTLDKEDWRTPDWDAQEWLDGLVTDGRSPQTVRTKYLAPARAVELSPIFGDGLIGQAAVVVG